MKTYDFNTKDVCGYPAFYIGENPFGPIFVLRVPGRDIVRGVFKRYEAQRKEEIHIKKGHLKNKDFMFADQYSFAGYYNKADNNFYLLDGHTRRLAMERGDLYIPDYVLVNCQIVDYLDNEARENYAKVQYDHYDSDKAKKSWTENNYTAAIVAGLPVDRFLTPHMVKKYALSYVNNKIFNKSVKNNSVNNGAKQDFILKTIYPEIKKMYAIEDKDIAVNKLGKKRICCATISAMMWTMFVTRNDSEKQIKVFNFWKDYLTVNKENLLVCRVYSNMDEMDDTVLSIPSKIMAAAEEVSTIIMSKVVNE